jgi:hypothetical protein
MPEFLELYYWVIKEEQSLVSLPDERKKPGAIHASGRSDYFFGGNDLPLCWPSFDGCLLPCADGLPFGGCLPLCDAPCAGCLPLCCRFLSWPLCCWPATAFPEAAGIIGGKRQEEAQRHRRG